MITTPNSITNGRRLLFDLDDGIFSLSGAGCIEYQEPDKESKKTPIDQSASRITTEQVRDYLPYPSFHLGLVAKPAGTMIQNTAAKRFAKKFG